MPDPESIDAWNERFSEGSKTTGYGLEGVTQHMPCPFCAAPGWSEWRLLDLAMTDCQPMKEERTCPECGRAAKFILTRDGSSTTSELVQTSGDDPPPYLLPVRRV